MSTTVQHSGVREGDALSIPLENGNFVGAVVARMPKRKKPRSMIVFCFGVSFHSSPSIAEFSLFGPKDAVLIKAVTTMGLTNGKWQIVGPLPSWERGDWALPPFVRKDLVSGRYTKIYYDDANVDCVLNEEPCLHSDADRLPEDGLAGDLFLQEKLQFILRDSISLESKGPESKKSKGPGAN